MNCIIVLIIFLLIIIIISNLSLFNNYNIVEKYVSDNSNKIITDINKDYHILDELNNKELSNNIKKKLLKLKTKSSDIEKRIKNESNTAKEILSTLDYIDGYSKPPIQNMYCKEHDIGYRYDNLHGCAKHCSLNDNCYSFSYSENDQKCYLSSNCYATNSEGNDNLLDEEQNILQRQINAIYKQGNTLYIKDPKDFPMKNYNVQIGKRCNDKSFKIDNQIKKINYKIDNNDGSTIGEDNVYCDPLTGKGDCYIKNCAKECENNDDCISFQYDLDNNECILNKNCYKNSGYQCVIDTNQYDCGDESTTDPINNREIYNYDSDKITYENNTFISDKLNYINSEIKENLSNDDKLNIIQSECESICELDDNCKGFDYTSTGKDKCRFSKNDSVKFVKNSNRKYCSKPINEKNINLYSRIVLANGKKEPSNIKCDICEVDTITDNVFLKLYRKENDGKPILTYINDRNNITEVRSVYKSNFEKFEISENTCLQLFSEINYKGDCKTIESDNNKFLLSDLEETIKNFNSFKILNGSCSSNDINDCNTS